MTSSLAAAADWPTGNLAAWQLGTLPILARKMFLLGLGLGVRLD